MTDYMVSNRSQNVSYDAVNSSITCQELGVIQGSEVGPLFSHIYSSNFARMSFTDGSILYVDDTVRVFFRNNIGKTY